MIVVLVCLLSELEKPILKLIYKNEKNSLENSKKKKK